MIDTHAHIYDIDFDSDREITLKRAKNAGVSKIFIPNIDVESIEPMLDVCKNNPDFCFPMLGLHPCYVKNDYKSQLQTLEKYLSSHKFIAIGEIGLDFFHDRTFETEQYEALKTQARWAFEHKMCINIHSRKANDETIKTLKELPFSKSLSGVFHCFSGTLEQAKRLADMNFCIGIGGVVTFKNAGLAEILKEIPLSQLVLETDAPYLAPNPHRGKRNESSYLHLIVDKLADIYETSPLEIKKTTTQTANKIFGVAE